MAQCVQAGKLVCLQYTLSLANGTPVDSSSESGTWTYVHGHTRMPAGLVKGVEGLTEGDHVRLTLAPEDAFGAMDPGAFQQLPKARFSASRSEERRVGKEFRSAWAHAHRSVQ